MTTEHVTQTDSKRKKSKQSVMCKIFLNMPYLCLKKISEKKRGQLPVMRDLIQTAKNSMGFFPLFLVRLNLTLY